MLLPIGIGLVDAVCLFKVFLFQRGKKIIDDPLLRVVPRQVEVQGDRDSNQYENADDPQPALRRAGIIFFCIHQCHTKPQSVRLNSKVESTNIRVANPPRYSRSGQIAANPTPLSSTALKPCTE